MYGKVLLLLCNVMDVLTGLVHTARLFSVTALDTFCPGKGSLGSWFDSSFGVFCVFWHRPGGVRLDWIAFGLSRGVGSRIILIYFHTACLLCIERYCIV